jgi:hypothetical protein
MSSPLMRSAVASSSGARGVVRVVLPRSAAARRGRVSQLAGVPASGAGDSALELQAESAPAPAVEAQEPEPKPVKPVARPGAVPVGQEAEAEEEKEEEAAPAEDAPPPVAAPVQPPAGGVAEPSPGASAPDPAAAPATAVSPVAPAASEVSPRAQEPVDPAAPPAPEEGTPTADGPIGLPTDKSRESPPRDRIESATAPQNALPPGQIAVPGGMSIALGSQMSFGQSTFQLDGGYARDPMVDWSLSLSPSYLFSDGTRISANASLSQELTQSGGDDEPQTVIFSDIGLNVSRALYQFNNGPRVFGSLAMQLPTSQGSRVETLITSLGARLSAAQPVGPVFISLGTGFRKNFHEYTHPVRDPRAGADLVTRDGLVVEEVVTGIARNGGSELAGATYFDGESSNTSMIWSNSLSAFWPVSEKFGLGLSYNLSHSWTYDSYDLDELSGEGARAGRGRSDSHGGTFFANYQALDQLAFGLGMATGGPTRTADDKRIRFPFFNFDGAESNMTTFFISATYTESIPL